MSAPGIVREDQSDLHLAELVRVDRLTGQVSSNSRVGTGSIFIMLDGTSVMAAGLFSYILRDSLGALLGLPQIGKTSLPHLNLLFLLVLYSLLTITCNAAQGLYSGRVVYSADVARTKLARAFLMSSLLVVMVIFVSNEKAVPRLMFATTCVLSLLTLVTSRYVVQQRQIRLLQRGVGARHVLIVGSGPIATSFCEYLETHTYLGKKVCGFIDDTPRPSRSWLGTAADLPRILKEHFVDEVYFTPGVSRDLIIDVALQARRDRISVKVVPDLYGGLALGAGITAVGDVPLLELNHQPIPALGLFIKRIIDLAIAGGAAVILSPLMLLIAIAIKLDSPGAVLYAAWRVGRKGRKFRCYKFRTMVSDADARKDELRHMNERDGATFKISNDPRITRVGRVLRKYSIDEFPQLFNVLKGDMSVVGPRPHPVDDYRQYGLEDLRRLDVLPGLTGLWQITARSDPSFQRNVELDLEYINNWNLSLDIKILLKTVPEVLRGNGR